MEKVGDEVAEDNVANSKSYMAKSNEKTKLEKRF
jgi:hypothetical protein